MQERRDPPVKLRPGDRVLFYGDSITEQHGWTLYLENLLLWQEPTLTIRNRGWAANRAEDGLARFDRDAAPLAPTHVFIAFGMNDGRYLPPCPEIADGYEAALTALARRARTLGAGAVLCSPPAVDEACDPVLAGYNETLALLTDRCRAVAEREGVPFVDFFHPTLAAGPGLSPDGIHPGPRGHVIMARAAAQQLGLTGWAERMHCGDGRAPVRSAGGAKPSGPSGSTVPAGVPAGATLLEDGTPEPVLPWRSAAPLKPGRYSVYVDGVRTGNFSAEELDSGVPLRGGGLTARARAVMALSQAFWQLDRMAWRTCGPLGCDQNRSPAAAAALAAAAADLETRRRNLLQQPFTVEARPEIPISLGPWRVFGPYRPDSPVLLTTQRFPPEPAADGTGQEAGPREQDGGSRGQSGNPARPAPPEGATVAAEGPEGFVDLLPLFGPLSQAVAYAECTFAAPADGELLLRLGSDDGYRLYLNGRCVADVPVFRGSAPGQEEYRLPVGKGANHLLLRVHQGIGDWHFFATAYQQPKGE